MLLQLISNWLFSFSQNSEKRIYVYLCYNNQQLVGIILKIYTDNEIKLGFSSYVLNFYLLLKMFMYNF